MSYAVVVVDVPSLRNRGFHYSIPALLSQEALPGARVIVPLSGREVTGVITAIDDHSPVAKVRDIKRILDSEPIYPPKLLALAEQVAAYYAASMASVLAAMLPAALRYRGQRLFRLLPHGQLQDGVELEAGEKDVVSLLLDQGLASLTDITRAVGSSAPVLIKRLQSRGMVESYTAFTPNAREKQQLLVHLVVDAEVALVRASEQAQRAPRRAQLIKDLVAAGGSLPAKQVPSSIRSKMVEEGLVRVESELLRRRPAGDVTVEGATVQLNEAQKNAVDQLVVSSRPSLLHGVTGSGKTEVYMHLIGEVLNQDRQAIVLVPEISLTPQTVNTFRRRFGERIAVLHSALGAGERYDEWHRVRRGEATVVIGARSAVFAPLPNLGAIIVDEEHETSYKQEETPRYHARDVAYLRSRQQGATLVLGSATPALESYYRAQQGHLQLLQLAERVGASSLPPVTVVDMREEMQAGNRTMFSRLLQEKIGAVLAERARVILFLNRRGYSAFVLCRECGTVVKCPQCDVSLTLHARSSRLRCHYCDFAQPAPDLCPNCKSSYIRGFGAGTERLEAEVKRLFPAAQVMRMDADTTTRRGSHQRILDEFSNTPGAILVGTQMIAKGLDIAQIQLVGIVTADTALNLPDFRSAERTFQLVAQVAGRSGRDGPGEVLLQTYHPEHYAIRAAAQHDYQSFYQQEIALRQEAGFPPFSHLARLVVSAGQEESARRMAVRLSQAAPQAGISLMGPSPAPLSRLHGLYRWQLVLNGVCRETVLTSAQSMYNVYESERASGIRLAVDVDPVSML